MKTITLKTDDNFFEKISKLAKNLHISKSELIREAVREYEKNLYKKNLKKKVQEASFKVRSSLSEEINEFEETNLDGLRDD
ncbi:ribbon-helix-helix protein, CopG family [Nitrosophilus alvini]|uniref:ribbon-helix-helix protein, CopG family n=1 Tax=Nitrosophilus alvini TaxID=2714855 RepID=UPI001909C1D1|nr:ribbon-helix-helix protein, CopG family [Nitrosophilus alvini]